jgi:ABC-type multidrug transport system fused ATPase/permease subunit
MLEPLCGDILIAGARIREIDPVILRSRIIAIPQEPCILPGDARKNLDPEGLCSEEQCSDVMELLKLSEGPLTPGQKQLLMLGRAVLRVRAKAGPGVLLLDELGGNADAEAARLMWTIIWKEFAGWTIVAVTHRLVDGFDRVVWVDKGVIQED